MQTPIFLRKGSLENETHLGLTGLLSKHCSDGDTGIVFVTTNDNKSCKIFLSNGKVDAINLRNNTGEAAPIELNRVGVKACSFSNRFKLPFANRDKVSSSEDVLTQLGCNTLESIT